ncbi:hypothetical protein ACIQV0_18185 [Lysinibacillus capsici]|uniref:hypothetical protein n=1 Tax=Lysinibacillus capsici TaxID=2115968 RepID=UPI0038190D17
MNIFQIKTAPDFRERLDEFINDNFICIGYPQLPDLNGFYKEELRELINQTYQYTGSKLGNHLGIINAFVNTMKSGDRVLINDGEWIRIGEINEYYFDKNYISEGMCHRRNVTWLGSAPKHQLNEYVKELLRNRSILTKFKHPVELAELDQLLNSNKTKVENNVIDEDVKEKMLRVLINALDSEDEGIRVSAASELIKLNKSFD